MKKLIYANIAFWGLSMSQVAAFDFSVSGSAETFTKWGFNNASLNKETGAAPTDSFSTLFSQVNLNAHLGAGFKLGLGGAIGGLAFDSTHNVTDGSLGLSPVINSYFGVSWDKERVQNYMVQNAFLEYTFEDVLYLKLGRYQSGKVGEYFSGYNQGAEGYLQFGVFKLWGFLSNRRAFAYDQWFNDYFRVHGTYDGGATRNTYALGIDLNVGYVSVSGFSYYVPGKLSAPGLSLTFDSNPKFENQGLRSITKIRTIFPIAASGWWGEDKSVRQNQFRGIEHRSATLYIEQKFELNNFHFGAGYYQNFGNANALIGTWGSPLNLDIWTANAYDIGPSLSDIVSKDAITGFLFVGADYGKLTWEILARGTNSSRSDELSVAIFSNYKIRDDISIGGKLEWLSDATKAGYYPLAGYYGAAYSLDKKRTDDRSHLFFYIRHTF